MLPGLAGRFDFHPSGGTLKWRKSNGALAMVSRRTLLAGTAFGASVMLGARAASALTMEEVPSQGGLGLALANRCGGASEHAQIAASLRAKLGAEGAAR